MYGFRTSEIIRKANFGDYLALDIIQKEAVRSRDRPDLLGWGWPDG